MAKQNSPSFLFAFILLFCIFLLFSGLNFNSSKRSVAFAQSCPPNAIERFGAGVALEGGTLTDYPVDQLNFGWWIDYQFGNYFDESADHEYVHVIKSYFLPRDENGDRVVDEDGTALRINFSIQALETYVAPMIRADPNAVWLIGNEPDNVTQDNRTATEYAIMYHDAYMFIKAEDPSALVAFGGISMPSKLRQKYLNNVIAEYQRLYGEKPPADIVHIHAFVMNEVVFPTDEQVNWGFGVPPGMSGIDSAIAYVAPKDHWDIDLFRSNLRDFRQWMNANGYRDKPLFVSEYGILLPSSFDENGVGSEEFMTSSFDFFLESTDGSTGSPTDGNRLVQRFSWFSLNFPDSTSQGPLNGALFVPFTDQLTDFGEAYREYTSLLIEECNIVSPPVPATDTSIPPTNTVTPLPPLTDTPVVPTATMPVPPQICGGLIQEAEDGFLIEPFTIGTDDSVSNGQYIYAPLESGNRLFGSGSSVEFCFTVPQLSTCKLKGLVYSNTGLSNSFYVTIDNVDSTVYLWDTHIDSWFVSDYLNDRDSGVDPIEFYLNAGPHIVTIHHRESETKLDTIELECDSEGVATPEPTVVEPPTETPVPLTETPVPSTNTSVPLTNTPVPSTDTPVPPTETPAPPTNTSAPPTDTPAPPTETPVPSTETPVPSTETPVPSTETPVPSTETPVPPTETPVPSTETPVPSTETPVPSTETPVPSTETPVPPTITWILPTSTSTDTSTPQDVAKTPEAEALAALSLNITADQTEVNLALDTTIVFSLTVVNNGNQAMSNLQIVNAVPKYMLFLELASSPEWICEDGTSTDTICTVNIATLAAKEEQTYAYTLNTDLPWPSDKTELQNTADVMLFSNETAEVVGANSVEISIPVVGLGPADSLFYFPFVGR